MEPLQSLAHERVGVKIYETALKGAVNHEQAHTRMRY
jgi:hypothetical protein